MIARRLLLHLLRSCLYQNQLYVAERVVFLSFFSLTTLLVDCQRLPPLPKALDRTFQRAGSGLMGVDR